MKQMIEVSANNIQIILLATLSPYLSAMIVISKNVNPITQLDGGIAIIPKSRGLNHTVTRVARIPTRKYKIAKSMARKKYRVKAYYKPKKKYSKFCKTIKG